MKEQSVQVTRRKGRRFAELCLVGALVAVVAGGVTAAYFSTTTNTESNVITTNASIGAKIVEDKWDPNQAKSMLPGVIVDKNPYIVNTNKSGDEYVAIRMTLQKAKSLNTDGTAKEWETMSQAEADNFFVGFSLDQNASVDPKTTGFSPDSRWERGDGGSGNKVAPIMMYYSQYSLPPGEQGSYSFVRKAHISSEAGNAPWKDGESVTLANYMTWLHTVCLNGHFQITFDGAAVQTQGFANAAAANVELKKLLPVT